jgi:hypothetical protein
MDLLTLPSSFCRAVWTTPLPNEQGAPHQRIIHARGVRAAAPLRLNRLGLRVGTGYFKCGSDPQTDWVTDLRVLVGDGHTWTVATTLRDVPQPTDATDTVWFDLHGLEAVAVLVELRRCAVDNWWPSWNLSMDGVILEGEVTDHPAPVYREPALNLAQCSLANLPAGVQAEQMGGEVRYRTKCLEVGFRVRKAAFSYLSLDEEGQGRTFNNLLQSGHIGFFNNPSRAYLTQGVQLSPEGFPDLLSYLNADVDGTTRIEGNVITYELHSAQAGQSYSLRWEVLEDRLLLSAQRTGERPLRAWDSSVWHMAFDSRVAPTTTLGAITRQGEAGLLTLPVLLHAPRFGTLNVNAQGEALWRADSVRPTFTTTNELKIGEAPQPEGDYLLLAGKHQAEVEWRVDTSPLVRVSAGAPGAVRRMLNRCAITGLTYRPDTATFSNNGNSMHAIICADNWSAIATRMAEVLPGLRATDLLRDTLERWLDGGQGYASGWSSHSKHLFEDEYLMSGTGALLGLADFLRAAGDPSWLAHYAPAIALELQRMRARDLDGDGLIESPYRLGISGQSQWSTCWFDVISFGWKDAFANALLYPALRTFADVLPRLGQPALAEGLADWATQLRASFMTAFFNPSTGWFGGWRSKDGALHDHAFLFVNGAAVNAELVEEPLAHDIITRLWGELQRAGLPDFRLGLPGNLWRIPDEDTATMQHNLPMGSYQNGGLTHSQARHFIGALYKVGLRDEADQILHGLCASMGDGTAYGGCGSGVDWRTWDGAPSGYEGLLCDQFGVLAPAIDRYGERLA